MSTVSDIYVRNRAHSIRRTVLSHKRPVNTANGVSAKTGSYRSEYREQVDGEFLLKRALQVNLLCLPSERSNDFYNFASGNVHEPQAALAETALIPLYNQDWADNVIQ